MPTCLHFATFTSVSICYQILSSCTLFPCVCTLPIKISFSTFIHEGIVHWNSICICRTVTICSKGNCANQIIRTSYHLVSNLLSSIGGSFELHAVEYCLSNQCKNLDSMFLGFILIGKYESKIQLSVC